MNRVHKELDALTGFAEINGTYYSSLAEALAAAQPGDVIKLVADTEYAGVLAFMKNYSIDLNGYTLKADGKETIDQIDLLDDLVTTSAGIYIGSAASDVEASYGTPTKQTDSSIQYKEGNCYLAFGIKDGDVASITFMRETN
jgi:hypothetical protein